MEIQVLGSISRGDAEALRAELPELRILVESGFDAERVLKVIGEFTDDQVGRIRGFLLRLLGAQQIGKITIKDGQVELADVPADRLDEIEALVENLAEILKKSKPRKK